MGCYHTIIGNNGISEIPGDLNIGGDLNVGGVGTFGGAGSGVQFKYNATITTLQDTIKYEKGKISNVQNILISPNFSTYQILKSDYILLISSLSFCTAKLPVVTVVDKGLEFYIKCISTTNQLVIKDSDLNEILTMTAGDYVRYAWNGTAWEVEFYYKSPHLVFPDTPNTLAAINDFVFADDTAIRLQVDPAINKIVTIKAIGGDPSTLDSNGKEIDGVIYDSWLSEGTQDENGDTSTLSDGTATFVTDGAIVGDEVYNIETGEHRTITALANTWASVSPAFTTLDENDRYLIRSQTGYYPLPDDHSFEMIYTGADKQWQITASHTP